MFHESDCGQIWENRRDNLQLLVDEEFPIPILVIQPKICSDIAETVLIDIPVVSTPPAVVSPPDSSIMSPTTVVSPDGPTQCMTLSSLPQQGTHGMETWA